ncbi:GSCFA domain-containing protein [Roseovarius aestuariivivens]|uniref:GSCFA domain-containing protein n=1 Tax=Roseovarius aestuariivivens TaxID=1888910 RepID=UPI0010814609|nr:GSCFA domain-containing protein [Roseovarius aestuariivivens]
MISTKDALRASRDNPHDRWTGGEGSAEERISRRIVVPQGRQSFTAGAGDTFFAIGSCFARNVEERLEAAGATVTSRHINVRDLGNMSAREGGMFNKYTPVSILQELKWAAGIESYPEEALLQESPGVYYDPYLSGKAGRGSIEELMERRAEVGAYFGQAFDADVVVITLGLIETWIDRKTGLSLNEAPAPRLLARGGERFGFQTLDLATCENAIKDTIAILKAHGKKGQRIIMTVSPVPLGRTFTDQDIIVANMTSKSTLRVAAMRLAEQTEGLDYFPSYEAVVTSDPNLSWQRDRRHVSDAVVGQIIETFLQRYGVSQRTQENLDEALEQLRNDPSFQKWSERAEDSEALMARLNQELNKYKNMTIKLQKELRHVRG